MSKHSFHLKIQKREGDRDFGDLSRDLINISQINFDTQENDFSMTNNLFNDKPTSRFVDYGKGDHLRDSNMLTQHGDSYGFGETVPIIVDREQIRIVYKIQGSGV